MLFLENSDEFSLTTREQFNTEEIETPDDRDDEPIGLINIIPNVAADELSLTTKVYNIFEPTFDTLNIMAFPDFFNAIFRAEEDIAKMNYPYLFYITVALSLFYILIVAQKKLNNPKIQLIINKTRAVTSGPSTLVLNLSSLSSIGALVLAAIHGGKFVKAYMPEYQYFLIMLGLSSLSIIAMAGPLGGYAALTKCYPRYEKLFKFLDWKSAGIRNFSKVNGLGNMFISLITVLTKISLKDKNYLQWFLLEKTPVSLFALAATIIMFHLEYWKERRFLVNGIRNICSGLALTVMNGLTLYAMHEQNNGPEHSFIDVAGIVLGLIICAPILFLLYLFFGPLLKKIFQSVTAYFNCDRFEEIKPISENSGRNYSSFVSQEEESYNSDEGESFETMIDVSENRGITCSTVCAKLSAFTNEAWSYVTSSLSIFGGKKNNFPELSVQATSVNDSEYKPF
jgi:hypothetical protein